MRAIPVFGLTLTIVCGVFCAQGPISVQKIYVEKNVKNDLASSASGYIFRSDGDNPPIYIKLGNGNINQYEDVLKDAGSLTIVKFNFFFSLRYIKFLMYTYIFHIYRRDDIKYVHHPRLLIIFCY